MITIASLRGGKLATLLLVTVLLLLQGRGYYVSVLFGICTNQSASLIYIYPARPASCHKVNMV